MWGKRDPGAEKMLERGGETGRGDSLGAGDEVREDGAGEERPEPGEVEPREAELGEVEPGEVEPRRPDNNNSLSLASPAAHLADNIKSMPNESPLLGSMTRDDVNLAVAVK